MALGVAFYAGIRSSEPDMRETAKRFYDENNYMDIWMVSPLGFTDEDIKDIEETDSKFTVEGMHAAEVFMKGENVNYQLSVKSICEKVNKVHVSEGRLPENDREVFVDSFFIENGDYKIGDEIELFLEPYDISFLLTNDKYKIVGFGTYPEYLSWERGTVSIGNGSADAFIFLDESAFAISRYTYAYITVEGAKELDPFLDEYDDFISEYTDKLEKLEKSGALVLDRNSIQSFVEYGQDAERIGRIGLVFPAVFFLVATLVSLTTMTRMVEEERTQIGVLKALGYSKWKIASKFLWYALSACLIGGVFGAIVGSKILPWVIIAAYKILYYHLPESVLDFRWGLSAFSVFIAVGCTVLATLGACYNELRAVPAILMRPVTPAAGRRIFLEHITPIWKNMSFSWKAACRNLFRYKKRLFMTIFGIGACMALLMVGFGLRDSIGDIVNNQYSNIWKFDAQISVRAETNAFDKNSPQYDKSFDVITDRISVRIITTNVESSEMKKEIELFVPEKLDGLDRFLGLQDRVTDEKYELKSQGVIISEKLAKQLEVKKDDKIYIYDGETNRKEIVITDVTENYLFYYVYMSADQYEELFGCSPEFNKVILKYKEDISEDEKKDISKAILKLPEVSALQNISDLYDTVSRMMKSLDLVIIVLIVSAALLAFIVLYNLNNINIIERRRELATIKVLGFYDNELAMYIYRENICLTVLGVIAGVIMGNFLHKFVIETCEIDMIMFGRDISTTSYILSVIMTFVFALAVNLVMARRLKTIDMVESLKSAE